MKLIFGIGVALFSVAIPGHTANAQTFQAPRIEVGVQGGLLGAAACPCVVPSIGPRLTINISRQGAIELSADTLAVSGEGIYGLYFLQYKGTTRPSLSLNRIRPFFTAGTGGYFTYRRVREYGQTRRDGSVVVYPAKSTGEVSRPNFASLGGGFERALTRRASFRLEGNGFVPLDRNDGFLGYRVLAGVSIPIGGYRASTTQ